jgi:hypothetical protein
MRQSVFLRLVAAGALCLLCSNCRSSERRSAVAAERVPGTALKQSAESLSLLHGDAADPALLNPSLDGAFEATTTEHFVVLHKPDATYVEEACRTLEYAYRHFYQVFAQAGFDLSRPSERLTWICFPQKSGFSKYALRVEGMDLSWLDGYYSTLTNRVAIVQPDPRIRQPEEATPSSARDVHVAVAAHRSPQEGVLAMPAGGPRFDVTRLTHEAAHQLSFNSGIQTRGVMYPLWVSEGLATNFEFDGPLTDGLEHCNTARCKGLVEAYRAGELVPLRQFVVQTTVPPDAHVGRRYYAQAWGFFQFLLLERPENLRTYLHRMAEERTERRDANTMLTEVTQAFGAPETLELSWNAFLARQAQQLSAGRSTPR